MEAESEWVVAGLEGPRPSPELQSPGLLGGGSRARNPARHFPGSALRARRGRGGLASLGKGDEARGNSGKLGVGDGPGLWLNPTGRLSPSPRSIYFLSSVWGKKGGAGAGAGPGAGSSRSRATGPEPAPSGSLRVEAAWAWASGSPSSWCQAHGGRGAHGSCLVHLQLFLMKVSKLLTLESSFILAFDQLRLEEEVLVEPSAFPQGSCVSRIFSPTAGYWKTHSFQMFT